jgi:hypothetical protein
MKTVIAIKNILTSIVVLHNTELDRKTLKAIDWDLMDKLYNHLDIILIKNLKAKETGK